MGAWNTKLYGNDVTCDVRDTYIDMLRDQKDNQEAYEHTLKMYEEFIGTDEECFVWYALAESQWKSGRLMENVKQKALECIDADEGCSIYDEIRNGEKKWKATLTSLKQLLESPMPKEKKYRNTKPEVYNPWEIGDVYAYRYSTEESKKCGLYGKYILMQKIENRKSCDNIWYSRVYVYDKVFDEIPKSNDIKNIRILPMDVPEKNEELRKKFPLNMSAVMGIEKRNDYPKERLIYLGNEKIDTIVPYYKNGTYYCWYGIEECLIQYYNKWQGVNYVIENGEYYTDDV